MPSPQDILLNALWDGNILGLDQTAIPSHMQALCVSKFNRRVSTWNAAGTMGSYEYSQVFTLPSAANSYTIGAAADSPALVVTAGRAPTRIDTAKRLLTTGATVYETPVSVLAFEEWNRLSIPGLVTSLTLAVYLETIPKLPKLWCYGFATGEQLRLSWKALLNTITIAMLSTNIDFQDGWENALTATLTEDLCLSFQKPISADLKEAARQARMTVLSLNNLPPIAYPDCIDDSPRTSANLATFLSRDI